MGLVTTKTGGTEKKKDEEKGDRQQKGILGGKEAKC